MVMLLTILALGLGLGRWTRRISPAVDVLLLVGVAAAVLAQMVAWRAGVDLDLSYLLHGGGPAAR